MNRIVGIETEFGCLVSSEGHGSGELWPARLKNHIFDKMEGGVIDLHYRDYEEPPGNGGFLRNGGRLYLDMGHLEYASPECVGLRDAVAYDVAGELLIQAALAELGVEEHVAILKNNIDYHTGATFGCHENYLMARALHFTPENLGTLLSFLATRQLFTGAGRIGQANPLAFEFEGADENPGVDFQLSQRADHIVNDIYQWVQFNRAIINARDEPLADFRRYRRLHLLIGDSNVSPFATALKLGTTSLVLTLIEEGILPPEVILEDAVIATRRISREGTGACVVGLANGKTRGALDIQQEFLAAAEKRFRGTDEETDWLLDAWRFTLDALVSKPELLIGGVDWISKKWLLDLFRESENLTWRDPWLQSLDLEYHNINPARGLFFGLNPAKAIGEFNALARRPESWRVPPDNTRALGRGKAIGLLRETNLSYTINWDSISIENRPAVAMPDPFHTYTREVDRLLRAPD